MPVKSNITKGWITSIIGALTMGITLYLIFTGSIDFVWEGIAGLGMGSLLFLSPQTIETAILDFIRAWGNKKNDNDEWHPHHHEEVEPNPDTNEPSIKDEPK